MSKIDLINHLISSKCPEIHKMIVELSQTHHEFEEFLTIFVKEGSEITKDNILYLPQSIWMTFFLIDAVKNNLYNCVIYPEEGKGAKVDLFGVGLNWNFFPNSYYIESKQEKFNMDFNPAKIDILQNILTRIKHCRENGIKVIIMPYSAFPHQNLLIYVVDDNKFIRFEPHGEKFNSSMYHPDFHKAKKIVRDFLKKEDEYMNYENDKYAEYNFNSNNIPTDVKKALKKNKKYIKDFKKKYNVEIENYRKYSQKENLINLDEKLNKALEEVFTKDIYDKYLINHLPPGATYDAPNLYTQAEKGFQHMEGKQAIKKMTNEEYEEKIGGFCVIWSVFYLNVLLKFPEWSFKKINTYAYNYLLNKGETAFFDLIVGYLQTMNRLIKKYVKEFEIKYFEKIGGGYVGTNELHHIIFKVEEFVEKFIKEEQKKLNNS